MPNTPTYILGFRAQKHYKEKCDVVRGLLSGLSPMATANKLGIPVSRVHTHWKRLMVSLANAVFSAHSIQGGSETIKEYYRLRDCRHNLKEFRNNKAQILYWLDVMDGEYSPCMRFPIFVLPYERSVCVACGTEYVDTNPSSDKLCRTCEMILKDAKEILLGFEDPVLYG